ncbi:MAG: phospho-N-acetylmuramoyl-pentapeptide-transferase [Bacillota bacterium]|nr:phospho-N-acetylmuramoyl-pentapeptide-transferase [Bacillota bacterium]
MNDFRVVNTILNIAPVVIGFVLCAVFTALLLPVLRRLKAGQTIRDEGPKEHQKKSGTPTMGGIAIVAAFIVGSILASLIAYKLGGYRIGNDLWVILIVTLAYAAIGFVDDYIKVVKKRNLGLTAIQKIVLQIVIAAALAIYCGTNYGTYINFPILNFSVDFKIFYYPFIVFVVVAMTNAVNLTDGLDGLAASITAIVSLTLALVGYNFIFSMITAFVLCGACFGFLVFNHHPAKIFMGDTGSLALGGALSAIAIVSRHEWVLPITGIVYVLEALSVIIQVFVFKTQNGRRFFRMAPLHHHFELGGMKETKVVMLFSAVTAVLCIIELLIVG